MDPYEPGPIGPRLRTLIQRQGLRPAEVARAAGMSRQNLHNTLSGTRADPAFSTVERIIRAMGCRLADLDPR